MARPPIVTLRLTDPRMGDRPRVGADDEKRLVREVQRRLAGVKRTGRYDCATAAAVQRWQWQQGAPEATGAIGPEGLLVLLGVRDRPEVWRERAAGRLTAAGAWKPVPNPVAAGCDDPVPAGAPGKLIIIPRSKVGLRPPRARLAAAHPITVPSVDHWQGGGRGAVGLEAAFAQLRGFQAHHMDANGWSDIGYGWAIPRGVPVGIVIELRGRGVRGAHSGHNVANGYPGVLVMMGADDDGPTADQLGTNAILRRELMRGRLTGHQEWSSTSCPGPDLMSYIRANRALAA